MRRARVFKRLDGWVVRLNHPGPRFDPLAGAEFWFDRHADALGWAVRMVGA